VVAEGSLLADAALLASGPAAPGPTAELRLVAAQRLTSRAPARPPAPPPTDVPPPVPVDEQDTVPSRTGELRPAVDPWPDAVPQPWTPDPGATVIKDSSSWVPPVSPAPPAPTRRQPAMPVTRPMSPARPAASSAPRAVARPVSRPAPGRPPKPRRPRRRGRFLRFLQVLLSIVVLLAVPLLAMVLAYGYGNGKSIQTDVERVFTDIARLVGLS
jgi:hypothetical protein